MPTVVGIGLRAFAYRLIMHLDGIAAIENGVRIRFASHIRLGRGVYLDEGVYLHACPNGIDIGDNTLVMHGAILHVYNFRNLPHSGIRIGRDSLIGEYNVIRGQGGVTIGDRVYTSPFVQIVAVNHVFSDPDRPFVEQGHHRPGDRRRGRRLDRIGSHHHRRRPHRPRRGGGRRRSGHQGRAGAHRGGRRPGPHAARSAARAVWPI